jgi:hypothetical protein
VSRGHPGCGTWRPVVLGVASVHLDSAHRSRPDPRVSVTNRAWRCRSASPATYAGVMARPAPPRESLTTRVVVGIVVLVVVWLVVRLMLGFVYSIVRSALFIALFLVVAWIVLVGPPGRRE